MRTIHQLTQGSDAWKAHRAAILNASEAPAVMGASKYTSRSELLKQKATGIVPEASAARQALFDRGHAVEPPTVAMIESVIGDELAPVVATIEIDGLTLGASYDGLTMLEDVAAEVKLWNQDLAEQIKRGEIEPHYYWQLEQQFIVTPTLEKIIFATSDGTPERFVWMEYRPVPGRRERLIAALKQFEADRAAYVPAEPVVEKIVAEPVEALPAPVVQVTGQLALTDNFKVFETKLRDFLEHRLIREPKTDEDFVNLDAQIKAMKQAREALKSAEAQMLAQVQPVDQAKKTKDMLDKLLRDNVGMAEKLLDAEKERRKGEIVAGGIAALREHVAKLNARFDRPLMPAVPADFGGAIRGLKSLASMEDKVATELARAKIAANEIADGIAANLRHLAPHAEQYGSLFPDLDRIATKAPDDFAATVSSRINAHKAAAERERERIRAEEQERAEREAREKLQREQEAAQRAQAPAPSPAPVAAPAAPPALSTKAPEANSPVVVPITRGAPTLRIGEIANRLGFGVTEQFLRQLGFAPAAKQGASCLFHEESFDPICEALVAHVRTIQAKQHEAVAA